MRRAARLLALPILAAALVLPAAPSARADGGLAVSGSPVTDGSGRVRLLVQRHSAIAIAAGRPAAVPSRQIVTVDQSRLPAVLAALGSDPDVESAEYDTRVQADWAPDDPSLGSQWGLARVGAPTLWDVTRGDPSIVVAVVDTGVAPGLAELAGKTVDGYDFVNGDADPSDDNGHGTAVASIIAAVTDNGTGIAGGCPDCRVMPVKAMDASGSGWASDVARGIDYAVDHGASVVNLSLGGQVHSSAFDISVARAAAHGVFVAAAAGNAGLSTPEYPAHSPGAFAVAGTTSSDALYSWSNRGDWVDAAAPGSNPAISRSGAVVSFAGTSSATPVVSAVVALLRAAAPSASPDAIASALRATASPVAGIPNGRIDGVAALRRLAPPVLAAFTSPAAPTAVHEGPLAVAWSEHPVSGISSRSLQRLSAAPATTGGCAGVSWSPDGAADGSPSSPSSVTGLRADTCYRWELSIADSSGFSSQKLSAPTIIDATPPPVPAVSLASATVASLSASGALLFGSDAAGTAVLRLSGADPSSGLAGASASGLPDGWSVSSAAVSDDRASVLLTLTWAAGASGGQMSVSTTDAAGNESAPVAVPLSADAAPPSVSVSSPAPGGTSLSRSSSFPLAYTASDDSGAVSVSARLLRSRPGARGDCPSASWETLWEIPIGPSPAQIGGLASGWCYRALVGATDAAGHRETALSGSILVDAVAPAVSATSPRAGSHTTRSASAVMGWRASDSGGSGLSVVTVTVQRAPVTARGALGGAWRTVSSRHAGASGSVRVALARGWAYRIVVTGTDRAGNRTSAVSGRIRRV